MWIFKSGLDCGDFKASQSDFAKRFLCEIDYEYEDIKDSLLPKLSFSAFNEYKLSGNRIKYENIYFSRRKMLRDFALQVWLGNNEAKNKLEETLLSICGEPAWALPAHIGKDAPEKAIDLFAAETAQTITEIVSLMSDILSENVVKICIDEVKKRVLTPFLTRVKPYNWERMGNNWCAVCGGCVGMVIIYLIEDDRKAKEILFGFHEVFDSYLSSFSEDGACLEGLYYWNYGMLYYISFLELYRNRFGCEFPSEKNMIKKMADFPRKCCITGGITTSFSDGGENDRIYAGLLSRLNLLYGTPVPEIGYIASFLGDNCARWLKASRDIAWFRNLPESFEEDVSCLENAQIAVIRKRGYSVSFKGGTNGEPHNHNDIGSFTAIKDGTVIFCDLGAGEYTKDYFSGGRYEIFCNRSMGHSVPIINSNEQSAGQDKFARSFYARKNSTGAEISGAYCTKELEQCFRNINVSENGIILTDTFSAKEEIEVTERFITRHNATKTDKGASIICDGCKIADLKTDNDSEIKISRHIHYDHQGSQITVTAIDFIFKINGETTFKAIIT